MSAQRDKPKLSLTKEESEMSQEDIVEKLQAALDAGILSQNDFDKLTQTEEVEAVDEKALSPKQKKIAAVAGDPGKIDAEDFKKLRKEEADNPIDDDDDDGLYHGNDRSQWGYKKGYKKPPMRKKKAKPVDDDDGLYHGNDRSQWGYKKPPMRKEETTAGVAAVAAALSRNLKELK
jgi:hypothetical protein